jgi:hypothetical protein
MVFRISAPSLRVIGAVLPPSLVSQRRGVRPLSSVLLGSEERERERERERESERVRESERERERERESEREREREVKRKGQEKR